MALLALSSPILVRRLPGMGLALVVLGALATGACSNQRVVGCETLLNCPDEGTGGATGGNGGADGGFSDAGAAGGASACAEECAGETPECDSATGDCVECTANSGCDEGICDPDTRTCVTSS